MSGFSNMDTMQVAVWASNDHKLYNSVRDLADAGKDGAVQRILTDAILTGDGAAVHVRRYLSSAVNWTEVADEFRD